MPSVHPPLSPLFSLYGIQHIRPLPYHSSNQDYTRLQTFCRFGRYLITQATKTTQDCRRSADSAATLSLKQPRLHKTADVLQIRPLPYYSSNQDYKRLQTFCRFGRYLITQATKTTQDCRRSADSAATLSLKQPRLQKTADVLQIRPLPYHSSNQDYKRLQTFCRFGRYLITQATRTTKDCRRSADVLV